MSSITDLTRGNWKQHGRPERVYWFGTGPEPDDEDGRIVAVSSAPGNRLSFNESETGEQVMLLGVAGKFWAAPVSARTTHDEVRHYSDGDSIAIVDGSREDCRQCTPRCDGDHPLGECNESGVPTCCGNESCGSCNNNGHLDRTPVKDWKPGTCHCGCGEATGKGSSFRQGHDARLVSKIVARYLAGEFTREDAAAMAGKVSQALATKTLRACENARSKADRKTRK